MKARIGFAAVMMLMAAVLSAQSGGTSSGSETSIEEAYLWQTAEGLLLNRLAVSPDRAMKEKALDRIANAIKDGKKTEDMLMVLAYLAVEGTYVQTRVGGTGRPVDDYPDIRRKACQLLGSFKGDLKAHEALLRVIYSNDFEPSVMAAAIYALAQVDIKDRRAEVFRAINAVVTRFGMLNPTDSLAMDIIKALRLIYESDGGLKDPLALDALIQIASNGAYSASVRDAALALIDEATGASKSSSGTTTKP